MKYTVYNSATGEILYTLSCADSVLATQNLVGHTWIDGDYSGDEYYIQSGSAVQKPARPQGCYDFDYAQKQWVINSTESANLIRYRRDSLLREFDRVNPVWYAALTSEQQTELAAYRQSLLDVPQQVSFPESVTWPQQPTWL
jgi:hypothetical protein